MLGTVHKISNLAEIASKYSTIFFDLDGVVWSGDEMIEKNVQAIRHLSKQQGKRIMFISNSSAKGRSYIVNRLTSHGINVTPEFVYTSAISTAMYIKKYYPDYRKILVFGSDILAKELAQEPLQTELCTLQGGTTVDDFKQMIQNIDKSIDALVVGVDYSMNFRKLSLASLYIQMGKPIFATNKDRYISVGGYKLPGAGSCVAQIEYATNTIATVVGKPNPFILNHIMETYALKHEECLMVGDNLHTDIEFGHNAKIDTLCTMTGVTAWQEIESGPPATYYCQHL